MSTSVFQLPATVRIDFTILLSTPGCITELLIPEKESPKLRPLCIAIFATPKSRLKPKGH